MALKNNPYLPFAPPVCAEGIGKAVITNMQKQNVQKVQKIQKIQKIPIEQIRLDGDTQARIQIDSQTVNDYAEAIANGVELPPIELFHDGSSYWPSDGFHRILAHAKAGKEKVAAMVMPGTCDEAAWVALSKNHTHGLRLSLEDRRKIIKDALLKRPELSDRAIAKHVGSSQNTVAKYRAEMGPGVQLNTSDNSDIDISASNKTTCGDISKMPDMRTGADGKQYPAKPIKVYTPKPDKLSSKPDKLQPKPDKSASHDPVDEVGNPLPGKESIRTAFQRRAEITELMSQVSSIRTHVLKVAENGDPLFAALNASQFQADCGNVYRALSAIRPHAVCPYCTGQGCEACLGRGWVGKLVYEHAPRDTKGGKQ